MSDETSVETAVLQEEAQERLSLDPLPDFVGGVVTVNGENTQAKLYKSLFVYCNKSSQTHPLSQSYCIGQLSTGKTLLVHGDFPNGGLNERQAKRLAVWVSPLDWSVDGNGKLKPETDAALDTLLAAYAERDWVSVEHMVREIEKKKLDSKPNPAYTTDVTNAETYPLNPNPQKDSTMSVTAEMPNGVQTSDQATPVETAPKKRGRRKRDANSKAAIARPGILMKPIAGFNSKNADNLAKEFGEKTALVYAAGVLVLSQLPIEQQAEAFKQAKVGHVQFVREEREKQEQAQG